jgi:hypothetical protein
MKFSDQKAAHYHFDLIKAVEYSFLNAYNDKQQIIRIIITGKEYKYDKNSWL